MGLYITVTLSMSRLNAYPRAIDWHLRLWCTFRREHAIA